MIGLVAQEWRPPEPMVRAIAYAGSPDGGEDVLYDFVHLGHVLAGRIGEYPGMPGRDLEIAPDVFERVVLDEATADELLHDLEDRLVEVLRLYG